VAVCAFLVTAHDQSWKGVKTESVYTGMVFAEPVVDPVVLEVVEDFPVVVVVVVVVVVFAVVADTPVVEEEAELEAEEEEEEEDVEEEGPQLGN